ncbi:MAG: MazG family protein [Acidimicrobiia bacterium]
MASKESVNRTLYLVGLGPGPTGFLTLAAWELLASGKPLKVRDLEHDAAQSVLERGFRFERVNAAEPKHIAAEVLAWASKHAESIYAVGGHPLEAPEIIPILQDSPPIGLAIEVVPSLGDLERLPPKDDLTQAYVIPEAMRAAVAFMRLVQVMARLRGPDGCPWDREQTHESLAVHLLEETYETLEAIDRADSAELREELGDILLQVVFHSELSRQDGEFEPADVVEGLITKLVERHPHVFGDVVANTADEVLENWETHKKKEKKRASALDGIPKHLPALLYAAKVQRRLSRENGTPVDRPSSDDVAAMAKAAIDGPSEDTVGKLLNEVVALSVEGEVDPEAALRKWVEKVGRFRS